LIEFKEARPVALIPYHPNQVTIKFSDGRYWYTFRKRHRNSGTKNITVDSSRVIHFKGLGFDGVRGESVISAMKNNLGLAIAAQNQGAQFYKDGMKLDGVIQTQHKMETDAKSNMRTSYEKTYLADEKRLMILDAGMEYKSIGIPQGDAQYIETRKFGLADVARMFRVPPPLLYDLDKASFNNISELIQSFVKFSLVPWIVNFDQEMNDKLFFESEKGTIFTKLNVEGLLRGDIKVRGEFYQKMIMNGILSPNEVRTKENMNPYEGGEDRFIAQNLKKIGEETTEPSNN